MFLYRHDTATCPHCSSVVAYGTKEEASSWKIVVQCNPQDGCGRELGKKRIPLTDIDHRDQVAKQAEAFAASRSR